MRSIQTRIITLLLSSVLFITSSLTEPDVMTVKLPYGVIRPQAAIDRDGVIHIIQANSKIRGDLMYVKHSPGQKQFSKPMKVLEGFTTLALNMEGVVGFQSHHGIVAVLAPC